MSASPVDPKLRIVYVCDFRSIHSRTYVSYFADRSDVYDVVVISTRAAPDMNGVRLISLAPPMRQAAMRASWLGALAYRATLWLPSLYKWLRGREDIAMIAGNARAVEQLGTELAPDVIHGFRTVPEAALATRLKGRCPSATFFVSTWGQDLVAWPTFGKAIEDETRRVMRTVDWLLPDNPRDANLARDSFGLNARAHVHVMPATGGLDMRSLEVPSGPIELAGAPRLLSTRGYENVYVKVRVMLEALAIFRRDFPGVHLFLDGPAGHSGERLTAGWVAKLGLERNVTMVSLDRPTLLRYMQACDMYVSATASDGLPMSLLESLSFGLTSVVRNHESTTRLVREAAGAVTFDAMTPNAIAEAWKAAMVHVPNRERNRAHNRALIREQYERDPNLDRVAAMYRGVSPVGRSPQTLDQSPLSRR